MNHQNVEDSDEDLSIVEKSPTKYAMYALKSAIVGFFTVFTLCTAALITVTITFPILQPCVKITLKYLTSVLGMDLFGGLYVYGNLLHFV